VKIVFTTGAGISVPSGISAYRGKEGIYTKNPGLEQSLTADNMRYYPERVKAAIQKMRDSIALGKPNAAHHAIVQLEHYHDVLVITQNVDGYHKKAGSTKVIELHGNIWEEYDDPYHRGQKRPNVVLFEEDLPEGAFNKALTAVEDADVVVAVGTSGTVYPAVHLLKSANNKAKVVKTPFYYLSMDHPETRLQYAEKRFGSADVTVPALCEELKSLG
jgi:NAD-dependent deacetylase